MIDVSIFPRITAKDLKTITLDDCLKFSHNRNNRNVLVFGLIDHGNYLIGCHRDNEGEIIIWDDPVTFFLNYTQVPF